MPCDVAPKKQAAISSWFKPPAMDVGKAAQQTRVETEAEQNRLERLAKQEEKQQRDAEDGGRQRGVSQDGIKA